jgi:hypothetical protein
MLNSDVGCVTRNTPCLLETNIPPELEFVKKSAGEIYEEIILGEALI